jgi:putative hemolysin
LATLPFAPAVAEWEVEQFGWSPNFQSVVAAAFILAIPMALLTLVLELVPKSFAALYPVRVALALDRFVRGFSILLSPLTFLVSGIAGLVTARFGGQASFVIANQAEEEIRTLVETAEEAGEMEKDERRMIHNVFEFSDTVAREVMTPRVDLDAMPIHAAPDEVMRVIVDSGHSRIPLFEETDDQIVGIVHAKDLLQAMIGGDGTIRLRKLMRPALFVPENMVLNDLLTEMRQTRSQMAIVQDEFGGTAGIVTIEDIVEELVGDIIDEYDDEVPEIVEQAGGFAVSGKANLDDVNQLVGSSFSSDEFDTLGGYVFGLFGRQPKPGETIDSDGYRFAVLETDGRRILQLRLDALEETADLFDDESARLH